MPGNIPLRRTPIYALHLAHGAKIVPFAGYEMPVSYADGILAEHLHTRNSAGLFDVSHMGQISVRGPSAGDIATALESLIPADLLALPPGRQKYGLLTNPAGGILDDLMVQNLGEHFALVVNAACKTQDFAHLQKHLGDPELGLGLELKLAEHLALLALQGPASAAVLGALSDDFTGMKFMDVREATIDGMPCTVSRSGYTGEDGFELSMAADHAEPLARQLLANPMVKLIGLGARDSLRLEAGLCLYGHDLTPSTTPVEGALNWAVSPARRASGARAGGFPGADVILPQMPKNIQRVRVGLLPGGRAPVREGAALLDAHGNPTGEVTSGGFAPSLGHPISMGYVKLQHAGPGTELLAVVRNKQLAVRVAPLPFVAANFCR